MANRPDDDKDRVITGKDAHDKDRVMTGRDDDPNSLRGSAEAVSLTPSAAYEPPVMAFDKTKPSPEKEEGK